MGLEDILNAFLGGAAAPSSEQAPPANDPLAEMLQGILGGGMPAGVGPADLPSGSAGIAGGDPLGGLLEGILGGGMGGPSDMGGMGGQPGMGGMDSLLAPMADALSRKLGLPPQIGAMIISFLFSKLLGGMATGGPGFPGGMDQPGGMAGGAQPRPSSGIPAEGLDLDSLLETMSQDKGMAKDLAAQTGLDEAVAQQSLQEALEMLGSQAREARTPRPSNRPSGGGLDNLLDTW